MSITTKIINGVTRYIVKIRDQHGVQIQKTFRLKNEAERFETESKQEVRRGSFVHQSKETIAERCDAWLNFKKSLRDKADAYRFGTLQNYETHIENYIKPVLGDRRVQLVTIKDCKDASLIWVEKCSPNTANMVLKTLTGVLASAQEEQVVEVNVAEKCPRLKVSTETQDDGGEVQPEDVYTESEMVALLNATEPGTPERILIELGGFCGLRIGEILGMTWTAIGDLKSKAPKVRVIKNLVPEEKFKSDFPGYGKTGRTLKDPKKKSRRTLKAPAPLISDLRIWKLKAPAPRPAPHPGADPLAKQLFMVTVEGKPFQKKYCQNMLDAATDRANENIEVQADKVPRRTLHRLRHTFASQLLKDGISLKDVSHFLGHKDTNLTSRVYAHFIDDDSTAIQDFSDRVMARAKKEKKTTKGGA